MIVPASEVINRYFRAVDQDEIDMLVACFTYVAAMADEGKTHRGRDEIRAWREQTRSAYLYTAELFPTEQGGDDRHVVTTKLSGNFPDRPVEMKACSRSAAS